jgi:hypothetical protein
MDQFAIIDELSKPAKTERFHELKEVPIKDETTEQLLRELLILLLRERRHKKEVAVYSGGGGSGSADAILMDNTGQS